MSSNLVKTVNTLVNKLSTPKRARRTNRRERRRTVRLSRSEGILAGYGGSVSSSFYSRMTDDGCIVRGTDLVKGDLPTLPGSFNGQISYFVTANPAAWGGTRIGGIAAVFQNYRPRKFVIHYRPQVGSTSTVAVYIGTMWQDNYVTTVNALEPGLVTSPGGTYLPAWNSTSDVVPLGNKLPQRMYPTRDPHFANVPFSLVVRANSTSGFQASQMPGKIFIEYEYEFRNAIGAGSTGFSPADYRWLDLSSIVSSSQTTAPVSGWIVGAVNQTGSGTPTDAVSNSVPLFSKLTWDFYQDTNGASMVRPVINGTPVFGSVGTLKVLVYSDDGLPG